MESGLGWQRLLVQLNIGLLMTCPVAEREGSLKFGLGAAYSLAWASVPVFSINQGQTE